MQMGLLQPTSIRSNSQALINNKFLRHIYIRRLGTTRIHLGNTSTRSNTAVLVPITAIHRCSILCYYDWAAKG